MISTVDILTLIFSIHFFSTFLVSSNKTTFYSTQEDKSRRLLQNYTYNSTFSCDIYQCPTPQFYSQKYWHQTDEGSCVPSSISPSDEHFDKCTHLNNVLSAYIKLEDVQSKSSNAAISPNNNNLYFVESSGRNYLLAREACAIESAIRNSGLAGNIIVAMTSQHLHIGGRHNATYQLYMKHAERRIHFRHVNVETIFKGTPIHQLHIDGKLKNPEKKIREIVQYR